MHLARSLYQELMMLGILSFVILMLNAEGYAQARLDDQKHSFHALSILVRELAQKDFCHVCILCHCSSC